MSKFLKFGALAAGLIGVLGFFLPLVSVTHEGITCELSTYSLVTGVDKIGDHCPGLASLEAAAAAEAEAAVVEFNKKLEDVRAAFAAIFIPSVLLLLFGVLGLALGRFGRGFGAMSLLCGLAALGIYALLLAVIGEAKAAEGGAGIGMHLVALSGVLGLLTGLMALIKPDTGLKKPGKRFKATVASKPPQF